jgi:hypothetical protein
MSNDTQRPTSLGSRVGGSAEGKILWRSGTPQVRPIGVRSPVDQSLKARRDLRFPLLILDQRQKKMLVWPLGFIMYVNMKPLLGGTFLAAPEHSIQVLPLTVAAWC